MSSELLFTNTAPVYKLWLGSKLHVIITSPLLLKQVVRDHDSVFANRDPPITALVATGGLNIAWSSNGPYWRDMRKLFAREMLSNNNLQASYVLRKQEVRRLVRKLNDKIGELIFLTELNVILSLLWGGKMDEDELDRLGAEFHEKVSIFVDLIGRPNVSDFFPGLARFDIQGIEKEMRVVLPGVDRILDSVIDVRMKTAVETKDRRRRW